MKTKYNRKCMKTKKKNVIWIYVTGGMLLLLLVVMSIQSGQLPFVADGTKTEHEVVFCQCVDGDTAWFYRDRERIKVRMLAIDAPEVAHTDQETAEPFADEAAEYTCQRLQDAGSIVLEYDPHADKTDKYDRVLAWVWVDDSLLQDELVEQGLAEVAYLYDDYLYAEQLKRRQKQAKQKQIGIWQGE